MRLTYSNSTLASLAQQSVFSSSKDACYHRQTKFVPVEDLSDTDDEMGDMRSGSSSRSSSSSHASS
jgi:hypothetical protein